MNQGHFAGYLGRDAELKSLPSGQSVCNFSVGVSTGWGDKKSTLWVSCAIWGERGEKLAQYLTKGSAVTVSGDVDVRAYKSKDGEPKAEITLNVQRVTLQGGGAVGGAGGNRDRDAEPTPQASRGPASKVDEDDASEIPF
jgi:single-strand DNA-binding protein